MSKKIQKYLSQTLSCVENAPLESDGFSLMLASKFDEAGWPYKRFAGIVHDNVGLKTVSPHLWIETHGFIIDYRLRMWLPDQPAIRVPHGVFTPSSARQAGFIYDGEPVTCQGISRSIIRLMSEGFSEKICLKTYVDDEQSKQ